MALFNGVIAGGSYGFSGWMVWGHDEPFDGPKFLRAIIWGVIVGVIAAFTGMPLPTTDTDAHAFARDLGLLGVLSGLLDQVCIWLWQRLKGQKPWRGGPKIAAT